MPRSKFFTVLAALAVSLAAGCASAVMHSTADLVGVAPAHQLVDIDGNPVPVAGSDRHVIVISVDGLRPDAIDRFGARAIRRLMNGGSYSLTAQTITPSRTLPSHTSMVTGVTPEVHGITWNDNQVTEMGKVQVPTMFRVARDHGRTTAAFASKGKLNHLFAPADLDHFVLPGGDDSWSSGRTASEVARFLAAGNRPNLMFVHFREPDRYGHIFGWMGYFYGRAVRQADDAVEVVLNAADEAYGPGGYTVILTADHGGHGRRHGSGAAEDMTIPWIAWGNGVEPTGPMTAAINTTDTAATALWLLGIPTPETFAGRPVTGAFDAGVFAQEAAPNVGTGAPGVAGMKTPAALGVEPEHPAESGQAAVPPF